jgi:putative oxidoreductase
MAWTNNVDSWQTKHHPIIYDIGRVALGLFLLYKGLMFISDTAALAQIMEKSQFEFIAFGLAHMVAFAHLVGGPMIALGLKTRFAAAVQIPILVGAVLFVNPNRGFYSENTELWVSILVLMVLVVYLIGGSGYYSLDRKMDEHATRTDPLWHHDTHSY